MKLHTLAPYVVMQKPHLEFISSDIFRLGVTNLDEGLNGLEPMF